MLTLMSDQTLSLNLKMADKKTPVLTTNQSTKNQITAAVMNKNHRINANLATTTYNDGNKKHSMLLSTKNVRKEYQDEETDTAGKGTLNKHLEELAMLGTELHKLARDQKV